MRQITHAAWAAVGAMMSAAVVSAAQAPSQEKYRPPVADLESYRPVPMPPGFGVLHTDVDGVVFTDARGMTLYTWPQKSLRNGDAGEDKDKPTCDNVKQRVTVGLMSPYPAGLVLPELDTRPTCTDVWPPVYAADDAKAVGRFTILKRKDGTKQWAFGGMALYTSVLDTKPGHVNGGQARALGNDSPAVRRPAGPPTPVPPAFLVRNVATGRIVTNRAGFSIYTWEGDGPNKSNCTAACLKDWVRVPAAQTTSAQGEWGLIEPEPGVKQWTFRGRPLYTRALDRRFRSLEGSDTPGWKNVYTQVNVDPPKGFSARDARIGQVLAAPDGKSVYIYNCGDDASDQLACDHPTTTQVYRLAICGNMDPVRCNQMFPYVHADADAKSDSLIWTPKWIDPNTGRYTEPNAPGALYVWTFRDRPIYTFSGDEKPGDVEGDSWGEFMGSRNGFKAFWLRDDFLANAG